MNGDEGNSKFPSERNWSNPTASRNDFAFIYAVDISRGSNDAY